MDIGSHLGRVAETVFECTARGFRVFTLRAFILLAVPSILVAQAHRMTVGIALEGGGAKGLAHIAVIQWFEDHHIPVDYIAGTSMGGLIGGLYATGHSPAEIEGIIGTVDWKQALTGQIPYPELAFRRKEDQSAYPNALVVGLRNGVTLPEGLNSGQTVRNLIDRYTLEYSERKSFDDLPIPFRCVATDLVTGKPKVFSDGPIAEAMRATMSLPAAFAPVRKNDHVYVDGGLLDNLPTDVVSQMGADIVIGVHLEVGPTDPKSVRSLFDVMNQSISVMISDNELRGIELADILITVNVSGFGTLDFDRSGQIIPKGREAAQAKANILSRLSLGDAEWKQYIAQREARRAKPVGPPEFIEVTGTDKRQARQISEKLADNVGQPVDPARLKQDLEELMSVGDYASLSYSLVERAGEPGLLITAEEKIYSPPWLKPGFEFNGAEPDNVGFTFAARLTFANVGGFRSEVRTDLAFGSRYGARVEYYHPFTARTNWFVAPQAFATRTPLNLYQSTTLLASYRLTRVGGTLDLGYQFDRFSELRIGYEAGHLNVSKYIGARELPEGSSRTGATHLRYVMDRRDNPIIPRRGTAVIAVPQWVDANLGARQGFPLADATLEGFLPVSKPASIYAVAEGATNFGYADTGLPAFSLGGPGRLAAYGVNQFLVDRFLYFRFGYLHRVATFHSSLASDVYVDAAYEIAKIYGLPNEPSVPQDGAVAVLINTALGPMAIGGSVGGGGNRSWFFQIGKVF